MGIADLALMTDCAHDVRLIAVIIDGVAHGLSINGQSFVLLAIGLIPALEGMVKMHGLHAHEYIPDDGQARNDVTPVAVSTAETLPGLLSKTFSPIRYGQVTVHPT